MTKFSISCNRKFEELREFRSFPEEMLLRGTDLIFGKGNWYVKNAGVEEKENGDLVIWWEVETKMVP